MDSKIFSQNCLLDLAHIYALIIGLKIYQKETEKF